LQRSGSKAEVKPLAQATVIAAGGDGTAPMIWSGGMAWIADFPDPSNFYGPILGCGGARAAVMRMIDEISAAQGMSAAEDYMLCSVCADLRISEVVDQPNWLVSFYFPKVVFA
jgi:hypothetical protein